MYFEAVWISFWITEHKEFENFKKSDYTLPLTITHKENSKNGAISQKRQWLSTKKEMNGIWIDLWMEQEKLAVRIT